MYALIALKGRAFRRGSNRPTHSSEFGKSCLIVNNPRDPKISCRSSKKLYHFTCSLCLCAPLFIAPKGHIVVSGHKPVDSHIQIWKKPVRAQTTTNKTKSHLPTRNLSHNSEVSTYYWPDVRNMSPFVNRTQGTQLCKLSILGGLTHPNLDER